MCVLKKQAKKPTSLLIIQPTQHILRRKYRGLPSEEETSQKPPVEVHGIKWELMSNIQLLSNRRILRSSVILGRTKKLQKTVQTFEHHLIAHTSYNLWTEVCSSALSNQVTTSLLEPGWENILEPP